MLALINRMHIEITLHGARAGAYEVWMPRDNCCDLLVRKRPLV
jgi:hypothetical protein